MLKLYNELSASRYLYDIRNKTVTFLRSWKEDIEYVEKLNKIKRPQNSKVVVTTIGNNHFIKKEYLINSVNNTYISYLPIILNFMSAEDKRTFMKRVQKDLIEAIVCVEEVLSDIEYYILRKIEEDFKKINLDYRTNTKFKNKLILHNVNNKYNLKYSSKEELTENAKGRIKEIEYVFNMCNIEPVYKTKSFKNGNVHITFDDYSAEFIKKIILMYRNHLPS